LPFLFNSSPEDLKRRYFIRLVQPPQDATGQVWLEAYPRSQEDAANFQRATLIINTNDMMLHALQLYMPGGKAWTAYQFYDARVNQNRWLGNIFGTKSPFIIETPDGWKALVYRQRQTTQTTGQGGAVQR